MPLTSDSKRIVELEIEHARKKMAEASIEQDKKYWASCLKELLEQRQTILKGEEA